MADWTTPDAVHSKCGETGGAEAILAIDDDTETRWQHPATCYHWIIFDMGETKRITKIRLFQDAYYDFRWGRASGIYVYVSDDPEDFGDAVWDGLVSATGWVESGAFSKDGRYIKLLSKHNGVNQRMFEFDAYAEVPPVVPVGGTVQQARLLDIVATKPEQIKPWSKRFPKLNPLRI